MSVGLLVFVFRTAKFEKERKRKEAIPECFVVLLK